MSAAAKKLDGLEALRGLAALLVVIHHVFGSIGKPQNYGSPLVWGFFDQGSLGVDIFFVLSGFVIAYSNPKDGRSWREILIYVLRRLARILPTFWVAFLVLVPLYVLFAEHRPGVFSFGNAVYDWFLLPTSRDHLLPVAWTLRYEIMFYLLFVPMLIYRRVGIALWVSLGIAIITMAGLGVVQSNDWLAQLFDLKVLEFLAGVLVCYHLASLGQISPRAARLLIWIGSALLLGLMVWPMWESKIPCWHQLCAAATMPLVYGLVSLPANPGGSRSTPMKWFMMLGKYSYSIYLFHYPLEQAAVKLALKVTGANPGMFVVWVVALSVLCFALTMGILAGKFIEIPLLERCKALIAKLKPATPALARPSMV